VRYSNWGKVNLNRSNSVGIKGSFGMVPDSLRIRNVSDSTQKRFSPETESLQKPFDYFSSFSFMKEMRKIEMSYLPSIELVSK
jgi:hypothetical protein